MEANEPILKEELKKIIHDHDYYPLPLKEDNQANEPVNKKSQKNQGKQKCHSSVPRFGPSFSILQIFSFIVNYDCNFKCSKHLLEYMYKFELLKFKKLFLSNPEFTKNHELFHVTQLCNVICNHLFW